MPATHQALEHIYSLSLAHVQIVPILQLPPCATIFSETWPLHVSASVSSFSLLFVFRRQSSLPRVRMRSGSRGARSPAPRMGSEFSHLTHSSPSCSLLEHFRVSPEKLPPMFPINRFYSSYEVCHRYARNLALSFLVVREKVSLFEKGRAIRACEVTGGGDQAKKGKDLRR